MSYQLSQQRIVEGKNIVNLVTAELEKYMHS